MEHETNIHWTSDPALVEDFVLNRIAEAERGRLEVHLRACDRCRSVVARERAVVAGVQAYGRKELKEKLREKLASQPNWNIPWPHIVSAAAVVIIVVGIGIFNHWFVTTNVDTLETTQEFSPPREPAKTGERRAETAREEAPLAGAGRGTEQPESKRDLSVSGTKDAPARPAGAEERTRRASDEEVGRSRAAERAQKAAEEAEKDALAGQFADEGAPPDRVWVEGILTEGVGGDRRDEAFRAAPAQLQKPERAKLGEREAQKETAAAQSFVIVQRNLRQNINVTQQPFEQLPADWKNKEKVSRTGVPTLLERTESGLNITIYSDDLGQPGQDVTVTPMSSDSLVVGIGEKRIGYRVPGGWGSQQKSAKGKQ